MSTCGECKNYSGNTCYSLAEAPSLLDMFYATTPACEHFEAKGGDADRPGAARNCSMEPTARPHVAAPPVGHAGGDPLAMLSPETRDKMARQDRQTHRGALPLRYWPGEER